MDQNDLKVLRTLSILEFVIALVLIGSGYHKTMLQMQLSDFKHSCKLRQRLLGILRYLFTGIFSEIFDISRDSHVKHTKSNTWFDFTLQRNNERMGWMVYFLYLHLFHYHPFCFGKDLMFKYY